MPWLEIVAALFSLAGIWLGTRRYVLSWPIVLVSILLYSVVFYQARLYSDTLLQAAFLIFTLYGWLHWQRGVRKEGIVRVEPLGWSAALMGLAAGAVGSFLLGFVMKHYTNAALPRIDSTLTSFSLVATWWQTRKHTANWLLWIAVDCVYTGVFLYKNLYWTSALYLLLVLLALLGLRDWRRAADSQRTRTGCRGWVLEPERVAALPTPPLKSPNSSGTFTPSSAQHHLHPTQSCAQLQHGSDSPMQYPQDRSARSCPSRPSRSQES